MKRFSTVLLPILLAACGSKGAGNDGSTTASSDTNTSETETTTSDTETTTSTSDTDSASGTGGGTTNTTNSTSEGTGATDSGGCGSFVCPPDGMTGNECDIWAQDCPDGEKCMPWANDGGGAWNATKCTPIDPNPNQPGDACTVEGSGVSGIDDCVQGAMCWNVDGETGMGVCEDFCFGSPENPMCEDPDDVCLITNEGSLILCLPICDPLLQNCPGANEACYLVDGVTITCGPDASGDGGAYGDPCEYDNLCDPGLYCAPAAAVPDCVGALGCCSEWCDVTAPNKDSQCGGQAGGQECLPFFDMGNAPPGFEDVGVCAIPQ